VLANVHKTFADGAFSLNATLGASIEDYKHRAILAVTQSLRAVTSRNTIFL